MGNALRLLASATAVLSFAAPAWADHFYSPFLDDLEETVTELDSIYDNPTTPDDFRKQRALVRALEALQAPSSSMQEDLALQARAVAALYPAFRDSAAMQRVVNHGLTLFQVRLEARIEELRALHFEDPLAPSPGAARAYSRAYVLSRRQNDVNRYRGARWKAAARQLQRVSANVDRMADALGAGRDYVFAEGAVTATIGGVPRTWRIASASYDSHGGVLVPGRLRIEAFSLAPGSTFFIDSSSDPQAGDPFGGGMFLAEYVSPASLFPFDQDLEYYQPDPAQTSTATVDAFDTVAGSLTISFSLKLYLPDGSAPVDVDGRFEITSGLVTY